jgi:NAD(P)-dependent dehydrogenase (short-subunit alcohol dehydrogenase family)
MVRVEGKVALVAGAGGGIGGAGALGLGREGGAVVCTDIDANAVEEHIQSAEYVHRRRNYGVDGRASQTDAFLDLDPGEW